MRVVPLAALALSAVLLACPAKNGSGHGGDAGTACDGGLRCQVVDCTGKPHATTSLSGTVYAPNGTLALYDVNIYVPNGDAGTLTPGLDGTCDRCANPLPGDPVTQTKSLADGTFVLPDVPVAPNLPVIIQVGKWRKVLSLPTAPAACDDTALPLVDTRLPVSAIETGGDIVSVSMPRIAVTTGSGDALECLVRKLGIADTEITTDTGGGQVHLFLGNGASGFNASFPGGQGAFSNATTLWSTYETLKNYDLVLFSCEGIQNAATKPQSSMDAVKKYADLGGRLFLSHWHNIWIEGDTQGGGGQAPAVWTGIATWGNGSATLASGSSAVIDEVKNPKGKAFADWMVSTGGTLSGVPDLVPLSAGTGKNTCATVDPAKAEQWMYLDGTNSGGVLGPQSFVFTTPNENAASARCGKVAFTDMHVSGDSSSTGAYPDHCATSLTLSSQEKALAFTLFQIEGCVVP